MSGTRMHMLIGADGRDEEMAHEAILLSRWQHGDPEALDQLIKENLPVAERLALKLTRDPDLAQDVISDVLIRVFRCAGKFNGQCRFKTWMHRIVVNCALDAKRKKGPLTTSLDRLTIDEDGSRLQMQLASEALDALDRIFEADQVRAIQRSVAKLDKGHRKLIYLFHGEDKGYREVSEALSIPIGTVKSRLHRARANVRGILEARERHPSRAHLNLKVG